MTFWTVAFYSFAWYFDEICPWQASRSPKSLLYCFKGKIKRLAESFSATTTSIKDPFEGYNPKYFEKAPRNELGIYIDNVTKKFAKSTAVDTISFSRYSGQTTLLLGHNGAGKTTRMNMILNNLAPDDMKLYIGGFNACSDEARSSLGLCPQESILLDKLTVDEHLLVFLKNAFGSAYKLRIECNKESENIILATITTHFPRAKLYDEQQAAANSSHINDITIELIPDAGKQDDQLIGMFEEIENRKDSLGIKSFGLKCSTVEDVFINSAKIFSDNALRSTGDSKLAIETFADRITSIVSPQGPTDISTYRLYTAFMKKHLLVLYRDYWSTILLRIIFPAAVMIYNSYILVSESACGNALYPSDLKRKSTLRDLFKLFPYVWFPLFVAFALVPSGESATKFKLMQICSRANHFIYWTSTLMVDLINAILYNFIFVISLEFQLENDQLRLFGGRLEFYSSLLILMIVFGLATTLLVYLLSNCLRDVTTTLITMFTVLHLPSIIKNIILSYLALFRIHIDPGPIDNFLYYLIPSKTIDVTLTRFIRTTFLVNCEITDDSQRIHLYYWSSELPKGTIILLSQAMLLAIMLYLIETRRLDTCSFFKCSTYCIDKRPTRKVSMDADVTMEERRARKILSNPLIRARNALIADDLVKSYTRSFRAVDGLTFAVDKAECFGLLGVNGAGKTTAFSLLCGDILPDHGSIVCNNLQLSDGADAYSGSIGFDPQTNPSTELTPVDAMYFLARLRGIEESRIKTIVDALLCVLSMQEHANKPLSRLSGGTKRKLSLSLAIIGSPPVLMLDEPTAGIDPVARRNIWLTLSALKSKLKSSIIISSHAMEECEAICDRLTIMVNGRMRCIGSFQHLRSKFGRQGYVVRIQFEAIPAFSDQQKKQASFINEYLSENLHCSVTLDDSSTNSVVYKINDGKIPRSSLFKVLKSLKHIIPT